QRVIEALAALGTAPAIPLLDRMLDDPVPAVRVAAVQALGQVKLAQAAAPLCRALKDSDSTVRLAVTVQFWIFAPPPPDEAIEPLRAALHDVSPPVRARAAWALRRCLNRATATIPELIASLSDADPEV